MRREKKSEVEIKTNFVFFSYHLLVEMGFGYFPSFSSASRRRNRFAIFLTFFSSTVCEKLYSSIENWNSVFEMEKVVELIGILDVMQDVGFQLKWMEY